GTFPTVIAAGSQGTFDVQLDTNTANTFNGELSFTTNDTDENPFNFAVSGVVSPNPVPEISVIQNTTNIADNTGTFDFGTSTVGSVVSKTFTIENNGTADLTLSELTLPTGLTLAGTFPTVIAAGSQGTFDVQLDTNTANTFNGELSFTTN
ncbi:hypothetical protein M595_6495, partial [Lyngbya aestuarii BL J]